MQRTSPKFFTGIGCLFGVLTILVMLGGTSPTDAAVDKNTVAVWLFEEGDGKTVKDASGNGHNGKFSGNLNWVEGEIWNGVRIPRGWQRLHRCGLH